MEHRRRDRSGDHLSATAGELRDRLLGLDEAAGMTASGNIDAAVLVPLYDWPEAPGLVFTERRADMRRHAGEVSFPGGRLDPGETFDQAALREASEEIGLDPGQVEVIGALPPIGTFVTNYVVHPIVGLVEPGQTYVASPAEVEKVLPLAIAELRDGFAMRRLVRRGIPIRTPTYVVGDDLIWGATARILGDLLRRMPEA